MAAAAQLFAATPQLIVQKVNNQGAVPGNTYRVYAQVEEGQSIHAVWGDTQHPIIIESTAPFYQNALASYGSNSIHPNLVAVDPNVQYDSFITLGYEDATNNTVWDIGVDFSSFNDGGEILVSNGAWFLLPQDEKCSPSNAGLVLLAQFTTTGAANGTLNLQGWEGQNEVWKALDLKFSTENAQTFGCTNAQASNYNPSATFNDGTCEDNATETVLSVATNASAENTWAVFPNPVRDQLIHIQLSNVTSETSKMSVDIFDMAGKKIVSRELSKGNFVSGNKVTIEQALSAGSYKIALTRDGVVETKTLVVAK